MAPPGRAAEVFRKYSIYRVNRLKISSDASSSFRPMFRRRSVWPKIRPQKRKSWRQKKLDVACESFVKMGCNRKMFTVKNIYKHGYTLDEFFDPLLCIKENGVLHWLWLGRHYSKDNLQSFIDHVNWLRTSEKGINTMKKTLGSSTTISKKQGQFKKCDVHLACKLIDYGASRWLAWKAIQNEINQLEVRRRELEIQSLDIDNDLKDKLGPLYEYKELFSNALRLEAYKLYQEHCLLNDQVPIGKDEEMGYSTAMEAFGEVAKDRHFLDYLNHPVRKTSIQDYFKNEVATLGERNADD